MIKVGYMRKQKKFDEWMHAASAFALMHRIELFHFTEDKISIENKSIFDEFWDVNKSCYIEKLTPFPDIISDSRIWRSDETRQLLLEQGVLTTWVNMGRKTKRYRILRNSHLKDYLIDTYEYNNVHIDDVLEKYNEVIIKPNNASLGRGVHKISKNGEKYSVHTGHEQKCLSASEFSKYDQFFKVQNFLVQEYIDSRTSSGNPFDIKVYLIRSGENGEWTHLTPLPRIGASLGVVSNVGAGGNALFFPDKFLKTEFGNTWQEVEQEINYIINAIPFVMEREYKRTINTIGVDIGFDRKSNRLKLFEVNSTIHLTPYKMDMCMKQMNLYKYLHKKHIS